MMYYKISNGELIAAPRSIVIDGRRVSNPSATQLMSAGWKPLIGSDAPEDSIDGDTITTYAPVYTENDDSISVAWVAEIEDVPPTAEDFTLTNDEIAEYIADVDYRVCLIEIGML